MTKTDEFLTDEETKLLKVWSPVFDKAGDLTTPKGKLYVASVLDKLRSQVSDLFKTGVVLSPTDELVVSAPDLESRVVVKLDDTGKKLTTKTQSKVVSWVDA